MPYTENMPRSENTDYQTVRALLEYLSEQFKQQPSMDDMARAIGLPPRQLTSLFERWAGLTPKAFLQALTLDSARAMLSERASILDTSLELGLSGPSRLHDLFVTHEAMPPGIYKNRGQGLTISYGFHDCRFGRALVMVSDYGLVGLAFADSGDEPRTLQDMQQRWPNATYREAPEVTAPTANQIFHHQNLNRDKPLRVTFIGTDFQIRVWETLLSIPMGKATTYGDIANWIERPKAARAVGAAVGSNPISFVVPCHRVLGKSAALTGYHWGLTRKRAILGWESGQVG